jgi:FixJ family two-component response regulator
MERREERQAVVAVIDDDRNIRDALESLLQSVGQPVKSYASVTEFLSSHQSVDLGCLVLDVRLPGKGGLEFYDDLIKADVRLPVVFISGHADVPMSVRAMKAGAVEFLTKPVRHQDLLDAIRLALEQHRVRCDEERSVAMIRACYDELTHRESEVMALVVAGRPNKEIASDLAISMTTVKLHRGQVMRKMGASSLAELVRMVESLKLSRPKV